MTEEQKQNDGITNYDLQVGTCARCGAAVYTPAKWSGIGERPLRRTCEHVGRILRPLDELSKEKPTRRKFFKQAGW